MEGALLSLGFSSLGVLVTVWKGRMAYESISPNELRERVGKALGLITPKDGVAVVYVTARSGGEAIMELGSNADGPVLSGALAEAQALLASRAMAAAVYSVVGGGPAEVTETEITGDPGSSLN